MDTYIKNALESSSLPAAGFGDGRIGEARIIVVGSGGAGNNTIYRLKERQIQGAELIAVNTDKQHLAAIQADKKILIGNEITRGLGAGGDPAIGEQAALEAKPKFKEMFSGVDMVFLTCGLGGGTGTGSLPVLAEIAKSCGALVIAAVTMPFVNERARIDKAKTALAKLKKNADSVIVIDNEKLLQIAPNLPINKAFALADEVLAGMVKGITETITIPSLMNIDFADVRAVLSDNNGDGIAVIGLGESDSRTRAQDAVEYALSNPLLDVDIRDANGALIHITGGKDLTLGEANEIVNLATTFLRQDANVIWGARIDPNYEGRVQVMVILTGVKSPQLEVDLGTQIDLDFSAGFGSPQFGRYFGNHQRTFKSHSASSGTNTRNSTQNSPSKPLWKDMGIDDIFS